MRTLQSFRCFGTVAALGVLTILPASATSIVILRSSAEVIIGADSTRTLRNAQGNFARSVCKIVPAGELLFVAAGLTFANGVEVADIGQATGARLRGSLAAHDPNAAMDDFRQRVMAFITIAFAAQGRLDLARSEVEQGRVVLEVAYIGFNGRQSSVVLEKYRVVGTTARDIRVLPERRLYNSETLGSYTYILLGAHGAIDKQLSEADPKIRTSGEASRTVYRLISQEESASSGATGGAIDVASLTAHGIRWLHSKPGCDVPVK